MQRFKLSGGNAEHIGNTDETLRIAIEEKKLLQFAKQIINGILNTFRLGDTLKGFFIKS